MPSLPHQQKQWIPSAFATSPPLSPESALGCGFAAAQRARAVPCLKRKRERPHGRKNKIKGACGGVTDLETFRWQPPRLELGGELLNGQRLCLCLGGNHCVDRVGERERRRRVGERGGGSAGSVSRLGALLGKSCETRKLDQSGHLATPRRRFLTAAARPVGLSSTLV